MNQRNLLIAVGLLAVGLGAYFFIIRPARLKSQDPQKDSRVVLINGKPA
jgi:preprotein translocase subunit YajC